MRGLYYFIVKPVESRYNNIKKIGDKELITNTENFTHQNVNRNAIVLSVPKGIDTDIKPGDEVIVHHNVFKYYNDMKGKERSGKSFFQDDLFFIDYDQFYMYKQNDEWFCHSKYCMIKPIPKKNHYLKTHQEEEPLMGLVKYPNEYLISKGIIKGTVVYFQPDSEYEYTIDGEKLYRMFDKNITMTL